MSLADYTLAGEVKPAVNSKVSTRGFDYVVGAEPWNWLIDASTTSTPQYCAATLAGEGTLAAALSTPKRGAATMAGAGTMAGGLSVSHNLVAELAADATLGAALTCRRALGATMAGAGTMSAGLSLSHYLAATANGAGSMDAYLTAGNEVDPDPLVLSGSLAPTRSSFVTPHTTSTFAA